MPYDPYDAPADETPIQRRHRLMNLTNEDYRPLADNVDLAEKAPLTQVEVKAKAKRARKAKAKKAERDAAKAESETAQPEPQVDIAETEQTSTVVDTPYRRY